MTYGGTITMNIVTISDNLNLGYIEISLSLVWSFFFQFWFENEKGVVLE